MKIAIEARAMSNQGSGIRTYTKQLISHLLTIAPQHTYHIIYDNAVSLGTFPHAHEHVVPLHHPFLISWWLNYQVPQFLKNLEVDVVHFTKSSVPRRMTIPTIVTLHDIIPVVYPVSQSPLLRWYWPRTLQYAATHADHIITISESSKKDIADIFSTPSEKITVTPLAVNKEHFQKVTDEKRLLAMRQKFQILRPFIFFLGTRDPRKNVPSLIRAFATIASEFPHQLVIAGKRGVAADHAQTTIHALHLEHRVTLLDFVDDANAIALYSSAELFVWPSIYEGWGFPPLEAMACGTPTIVSNGGALPEVVGNAGITIPFSTNIITDRTDDRDFEKRLAQAMRKVLSNPAEQEHMRTQGYAQIQKFSWESVAQKTLNAYEKIC